MVKLRNGGEVELELFKFDSCGFCRIVAQEIRDLGVEGIRLRDLQREPDASQELVRRGGKRQVPCLFIDGAPLYESQDIVAWLRENLG